MLTVVAGAAPVGGSPLLMMASAVNADYPALEKVMCTNGS